MSFEGEITAFLSNQRRRVADARQMAALRLSCGIDLETAFAAEPEERSRIIARIERKLRRERLRGLARHWSYDLNRHIALKQALDRLLAVYGNEKGGPAAAFGSQAV